MHKPQRRPSNVKWFEDRPRRKGKRKASPQQIVGLRLHELARLLASRYRGTQLPDDDSGRDDIEPVLHHIAGLTQAARRAGYWLDLWAPWMDRAESQTIITAGIASARAWTADQLAWRYRVTREEREMLGLRTIGAIDQGKAARTQRRKHRDRQRKANARRAAGMLPRSEYEGAATERAKPWIAEGISRRTWYRRRAAQSPNGTGPATV